MSNGRAEVQIDAKQDLATTFSAQGHTTMSCVVNLFLPTICNIRSDLETLSIGGCDPQSDAPPKLPRRISAPSSNYHICWNGPSNMLATLIPSRDVRFHEALRDSLTSSCQSCIETWNQRSEFLSSAGPVAGKDRQRPGLSGQPDQLEQRHPQNGLTRSAKFLRLAVIQLDRCQSARTQNDSVKAVLHGGILTPKYVCAFCGRSGTRSAVPLLVDANSKACTNRQEPRRDSVIQADDPERFAILAAVEQGIQGWQPRKYTDETVLASD